MAKKQERPKCEVLIEGEPCGKDLMIYGKQCPKCFVAKRHSSMEAVIAATLDSILKTLQK